MIQMESVIRTHSSSKDPKKFILKMMNDHLKQPIATEYTLEGASTRGLPARDPFITTPVYNYMRGKF
jgi:hypothetical protein